MNPFSMWDSFKTGTAITAVLGGVGILLAGLAAVLSGHLGWTEFGLGAFTVLMGILSIVRGRKALGQNTAVTQATNQKLTQIINQSQGATVNRDFPPLQPPGA